ncbi:hypothetical protein MKX03_021673 [Papaver bracteatum]|nr:hypothetical protein MKX03_021673 [Papaver bracteatum]
MSILDYLVTATNSSFFLLTKHPVFLRSYGTGTEIGFFSTFFTLLTRAFWGRPMISFELASISICVGPIDIPIIKFSVNWWNTLHQPGNISRYGTSIHVLIPIFLTLLTPHSSLYYSSFWKRGF